jgi:hypothetical protein
MKSIIHRNETVADVGSWELSGSRLDECRGAGSRRWVLLARGVQQGAGSRGRSGLVSTRGSVATAWLGRGEKGGSLAWGWSRARRGGSGAGARARVLGSWAPSGP